MHGIWQQCWLAKPASMVGNRFVVLTILPGLHTSFHWAALAKAYKQLWKDFVVTILCAVHVADAFASRSHLTTTRMISILLSKHLQEQVRDEFFRDRTSSGYADNSPTTVLSFPEPRLGPMPSRHMSRSMNRASSRESARNSYPLVSSSVWAALLLPFLLGPILDPASLC